MAKQEMFYETTEMGKLMDYPPCQQPIFVLFFQENQTQENSPVQSIPTLKGPCKVHSK